MGRREKITSEVLEIVIPTLVLCRQDDYWEAVQ